MVAETPHTVVEVGMKISHAINFQTTHHRPEPCVNSRTNLSRPSLLNEKLSLVSKTFGGKLSKVVGDHPCIM